MVVRHVKYTLKSGKADEYFRLQKEYAARAANMDGVGPTNLFVDPNNPNTIFVYVEFENEEAAVAMQESALMKEYGAKLRPLIERWDLYKQYTSCDEKTLQPLFG